MFTLGVTGGIGSGKSTVTRAFSEFGITIVDADEVAREVVQPGEPALERISEHFGNHVLLTNGSLDRGALRKVIFQHKEQKEWLESLLHPLINTAVREKLAQDKQGPYQIYSAPLLLENKQIELVDRLLIVDVPVDCQIERSTKRDNAPADSIKSIIEQQMPRKERLKYADFVIDNSRSVALTVQQVAEIHQQILSLLD